MSDIHIIPRPVRIEPGSGVLRLDADTTIGAPDPGHAAATLLAGMLRTSTGWAVPVQPASARFDSCWMPHAPRWATRVTN